MQKKKKIESDNWHNFCMKENNYFVRNVLISDKKKHIERKTEIKTQSKSSF